MRDVDPSTGLIRFPKTEHLKNAIVHTKVTVERSVLCRRLMAVQCIEIRPDSSLNNRAVSLYEIANAVRRVLAVYCILVIVL